MDFFELIGCKPYFIYCWTDTKDKGAGKDGTRAFCAVFSGNHSFNSGFIFAGFLSHNVYFFVCVWSRSSFYASDPGRQKQIYKINRRILLCTPAAALAFAHYFSLQDF